MRSEFKINEDGVVVKNVTAKEYREGIISDPSIHYWVKRAIQELEGHDAVDACFDAKMVAEYFELRLKEMQS